MWKEEILTVCPWCSVKVSAYNLTTHCVFSIRSHFSIRRKVLYRNQHSALIISTFSTWPASLPLSSLSQLLCDRRQLNHVRLQKCTKLYPAWLASSTRTLGMSNSVSLNKLNHVLSGRNLELNTMPQEILWIPYGVWYTGTSDSQAIAGRICSIPFSRFQTTYCLSNRSLTRFFDHFVEPWATLYFCRTPDANEDDLWYAGKWLIIHREQLHPSLPS